MPSGDSPDRRGRDFPHDRPDPVGARGAVPVTDPGPADMDEGASGDGAGKDSKSDDKKSDEKGSGSSPKDT